MSDRANNAPMGEQDTRREESLVALVACNGRASDHHGKQIAAARRTVTHLPDPALVGLVRLLARQAAREAFEASMRPEHGEGEPE